MQMQDEKKGSNNKALIGFVVFLIIGTIIGVLIWQSQSSSPSLPADEPTPSVPSYSNQPPSTEVIEEAVLRSIDKRISLGFDLDWVEKVDLIRIGIHQGSLGGGWWPIEVNLIGNGLIETHNGMIAQNEFGDWEAVVFGI